jgi:hypothetical protein
MCAGFVALAAAALDGPFAASHFPTLGSRDLEQVYRIAARIPPPKYYLLIDPLQILLTRVPPRLAVSTSGERQNGLIGSLDIQTDCRDYKWVYKSDRSERNLTRMRNNIKVSEKVGVFTLVGHS